MGTYVVGDIHGCFNEWIELKETIECEDKEAKFILVGDIVDRGPRILDTIKWCMKNITPDGKYQMVLGNHEDMKIELWRRYKVMKAKGIKGKNFKDYIYDPYGTLEYLWETGVTEEELDSIIEWFKALPVYKEIELEIFGKLVRYVIVHSNVPEECIDSNGHFLENMLDKKDAEMCFIGDYKQLVVWDRNYKGNRWKHNTIVVHGHTPTLASELIERGAIKGQIDFLYKDINVDCGMVYYESGSNLAAIRLEDLKEFYVYTIENKREHSGKKSMEHGIKSNWQEDMI